MWETYQYVLVGVRNHPGVVANRDIKRKKNGTKQKQAFNLNFVVC